MPKSHQKPSISPILALTIIRQILRGEGEYAAIAEAGDQHDAISEIVDRALQPAKASPPMLTLPKVETFRRIDPVKQAYLDALVTIAGKHDYWIKDVAGSTEVYPVNNMPEAMAAIFSESLTTVTFENFSGQTFWVKCNVNDGEGFFEDWSSDAEVYVQIATSIDPQGCR